MKRKINKIIGILTLFACILGTNSPVLANAETDYLMAESAKITETKRTEVSYDISFKKISSWEKHISGEITVKNNGDSVIKDWKMEFAFEGKIEHIWNASEVSDEGNTTVISNVGWNRDIPVGSEVSFGFTALVDDVDVEPKEFCLLGTENQDSVDYIMDRDEIEELEANLSEKPEQILGNMFMVQQFAAVKGNGYSYGVPTDISDFGCSIAGKKAVFHLDVGFNWNGKYVYATDEHYWRVFLAQGLIIKDIKPEITKAKNKSTVCAKCIRKITLKNVDKERTRTFVFGYKCTPKGVMKRVAYLE